MKKIKTWSDYFQKVFKHKNLIDLIFDKFVYDRPLLELTNKYLPINNKSQKILEIGCGSALQSAMFSFFC